MSIARPKRTVAVLSKRCSKCGIEKPATDFIADTRHADGLRSECKECFYSRERNLKSMEWRRANPERVRGYNAGQRKARAEYQKRWRTNNRERTAKKDHESHEAYKLRHYDDWLESHRVGVHKRRALTRGSDVNDLTTAQWKTIKAAYGGRCAYCGLKFNRLTMDHVVPISKGGTHTALNVVPCCRACNSRKHTNDAPTHQPHLLA